MQKTFISTEYRLYYNLISERLQTKKMRLYYCGDTMDTDITCTVKKRNHP